MPPAIDVLCDASVVLKWFHAEGEQEVGESRALLELQRSGEVSLAILDLTVYEVGNVLVRSMRLRADRARTVLEALDLICPRLTPTPVELADALALAEQHGLTLYDAAYAAVARSRGARLVTLDGLLLNLELGERPAALACG
jgi:predicted nucleic acid-binding protein